MHPESFITPQSLAFFPMVIFDIYINDLNAYMQSVYIGSTKVMMTSAAGIGHIEETRRASLLGHTLTYAGRGVQQHIPHAHSDTFSREVVLHPNHLFFNTAPFKGWDSNKNEVVYNLDWVLKAK